MKNRNEIVAIAIMLIFCLLFAACAQKAEDKLTDKATDPSLISTTDVDSGFVDNRQTTSKSKPISAENAEKKLVEFYGTLYKVQKTDDEHYVIKDNHNKEYAKVKVYLKGGVFTETVTDSGEKNVIRFEDIK